MWVFAGLVGLGFGGVQAVGAGAPSRSVASKSTTEPFCGRALRYAPAAQSDYTYEGGGTAYTGERVSVETRPVEADNEERQLRLHDYPIGAVVRVYYTPAAQLGPC